MSERYKDSYCGYLIDHHSPDPPVQRLDRLDVREWEESLRRAHVDCMLTYCKDHYGVTYYDTKVGRKHPGVKGDFIAQAAEMMRRNGIEFFAYYSLGFDLWAAKTHPEWALRDEEGNVLRIGTKWPWCCGNTGYRGYMMAQLEEILAYQPDSLFLDIVMTPLCWCESCQARFQERYGFPLPRGEAMRDHWRILVDWHNEVLQYDLFQALTSHVRSVAPDVAITLNGSHMGHTKRVMELFDWTYAEPWAGNFVSAGFARGTGKDPQIGPGGLSQVYNPYPPSVYVAEIAAIAAQGARPFLFSGSLKPDGSLDRLEFDEIGAAYSEAEKFQDLLRDREPIREVGIVYSESTRLYGLDQVRIAASRMSVLDQSGYTEALAGAINAAALTKYPWEVIPEWKLTAEELSRYRVLVLPNVTALSDGQAGLIDEWVRGGGKLLATFRTSLRDEQGEMRDDFALAGTLGVAFAGMEESYAGSQQYGSYLENRVGPLWTDLPDTALGVAPPMVRVRPTSAEVLATHTLPACRVTPDQWVNWWSPPPDARTEWPAVTLNRHGAGLALWVGFDLFTMLRQPGGHPFVWARQFLTSALEKVLLPDPCLRVHTLHPEALDATYFQVRGKSQVLVHLLNSTVRTLNGNVLPVPGATLVSRGRPFRPRSARVIYPAPAELPIQEVGGVVEVALLPVAIHTIVSLDA